MSYSIPSVLSIAGSDSSGGAGVQADIKTIEAFGLFAQTAITALTAQNTLGVTAVEDVSEAMVRAQIRAVFSDIVPQAVKIGMVSSAEIVCALAEELEAAGARHIVLDPVMVSTSGSRLIGEGVARVLVERLFPLAEVITPNIPEAEALTGLLIKSKDDMEQAARLLGALTPGAVLLKGGHGIDPDRADDVLVVAGEVRWFEGRRIESNNTHGTGCTLSSALASGLASGLELDEAVARAKAYVWEAISAGLDLGKGSGPLDHGWQRRLR